MHDPMTVAFDIKNPFVRGDYKPSLITVWHVDPERDGSDDSCDWFGGKRGMPEGVLADIRRVFAFEGRDDGSMSWFGCDKYSPDLIGVGLAMFRIAANNHFGHWSKAADKFLRNNLFDILFFIDNSCDSINSELRRADAASGRERQEILDRLAYVVYAWILRRNRPWWKHPRWHVWHWRIQFHPWQNLKRRWWDKCCRCGKRGFPPGEAAIGNWDGDQIWHAKCAGKEPTHAG